jgi:hypothetical protein
MACTQVYVIVENFENLDDRWYLCICVCVCVDGWVGEWVVSVVALRVRFSVCSVGAKVRRLVVSLYDTLESEPLGRI